MNEDTIKLISDLYLQGYSSGTIAKKIGSSKTTILSNLDRAGVKRRTGFDAMMKYKRDLTFFEKIDSHVKAQILGFIYADGAVPAKRENCITIGIAEQDREYLDFIKKEIKYEGNIWISPRGNPRWQNKHILTISSKKMAADIIKLGCVPNKEEILQFPNESQVPKEFLPSFMLGYLEGDGCISISHPEYRKHPDFCICICGTKDFLTKYAEVLNKNLNTHCRIVESPGIWSLRVAGNRQVRLILDWLYSKVGYSLSRKRNRYEQLKIVNENSRKFKERVAPKETQSSYHLVTNGSYNKNKDRIKKSQELSGVSSLKEEVGSEMLVVRV